MKTLYTILQLIGLILEIIGVVCMANMYVKIHPKWKIIKQLGSALVGGKLFRGATSGGTYLTENIGVSFRGLSLVGLGFCVQAIGVILSFFM